MFIMVFITLLDNKEYPVFLLPFSPGGIPINEARGVRLNVNNSFVGSTSYSNSVEPFNVVAMAIPPDTTILSRMTSEMIVDPY